MIVASGLIPDFIFFGVQTFRFAKSKKVKLKLYTPESHLRSWADVIIRLLIRWMITSSGSME